MEEVEELKREERILKEKVKENTRKKEGEKKMVREREQEKERMIIVGGKGAGSEKETLQQLKMRSGNGSKSKPYVRRASRA
jgi:hypothetical protein